MGQRKPPPCDLLITDDDFLDEYSVRPSWSCNPIEASNLEYDFYLYGYDISYFTGKLECYARYKELKFRRVEPTVRQISKIQFKYTGIAQVPLLYDARPQIDDNKRWLRDTTSIIEHLEKDGSIHTNTLSKDSDGKVIPDDPVQRFLSFVIEDYAGFCMALNLGKLIVYRRSALEDGNAPALDRKVMSTRFVYEFARRPPVFLPFGLRPGLLAMRQWLYSVYGEGINTTEQNNEVFEQYRNLLGVLQTILEENDFIGGKFPTIVDFGFAGPMFRHCASDPTPRKIMQQEAPAVYEWIARLFNAKQSRLIEKNKRQGLPGISENQWRLLLSLIARDQYFEYLKANSEAFREGKSDFEFNGCVVPMVHFRVWCRQKLQKRYIELLNTNKKAALKVHTILEETNCWKGLFPSERYSEEVIECPPELHLEPPFVEQKRNLNQMIGGKWPLAEILGRYILQVTLPSMALRIPPFVLMAYINKILLDSKLNVQLMFAVYMALKFLERYSFFESNSISKL